MVFLTFEIPFQINNILLKIYPDVNISNPMVQPQEMNQVLNVLRPIGYLSLLIILLLIIIGSLIKSKKITVTSSLLLFLPTFGGFAMTMFFLAGIGILQVFWLPFDTLIFNFLTLGFILEIPYILFVLIFSPVYFIFPIIFMFIGLYIFTAGVISWMYGKYQKKEIIDFMIYKHSRHPQYLGFLIWSYGVFLLYAFNDHIITAIGRNSLFASLPWLLSSLIIIYVAFIEDIKLSKKYPDQYSKYRKKTPFLLKLPSAKLNAFISFSFRIIIRKNFPESRKDVVKVIIFYALIIMVFSFFLWNLWSLILKYVF